MTRFVLLSTFLGLVLAGCTRPDTASSPAPSTPAALYDEWPTITVYKTPTCGCCVKWMDHLAANGFPVEGEDRPDMVPTKETLGVPGPLRSCHTALVDGYVIEGHVPAADIQRLLDERPDIVGLSVPAMPIGSPGMEVEGRPAQAYQVIAFDAEGEQTVFAEY
ncbi:MAG: DUF411 domain-containing protein [Bacteroidota bacterium]